MDLARIKVTVDKMVDPSIDIEATLQSLDGMAIVVKSMAPPFGSSTARLEALKKYLYTPGKWNNGEIFHYDFDDPKGTKIPNKMLSNYIISKKGNCITMPLLFVILGDKLGLNVTASTAPLHLLVKFNLAPVIAVSFS